MGTQQLVEFYSDSSSKTFSEGLGDVSYSSESSSYGTESFSGLNSTLYDELATPNLDQDLVLLPDWGHNLFGSALVVSGCIAAPLNFIVILAMRRIKKLNTPTNCFIESLAWSDFFIAILGNTTAAVASFQHKWLLGDLMCTIYAFLMMFLGLASLINLSAIALDRYYVIAKPTTNPITTMRKARCVSGACWLYAFVWSICPLLGWNGFVIEGVHTACSIDWTSQEPADIAYIYCIFVFVLLLPIAVIIYSYYYVYMTVRHIAEASSQVANKMAKRQKMMERKLAKTIILMTVCFLVSWLPYASVSLATTIGGAHVISPVGGALPALLAKCSCSWNPLIYVGTNEMFRKEIKAWLCPGSFKINPKQKRRKSSGHQDQEMQMGADTSISQTTPYGNGRQDTSDA